MASTVLLPLSHRRLVHLGFENCSDQRIECIVFLDLKHSEVLIGYIVKLAKLFTIAIYQ